MDLYSPRGRLEGQYRMHIRRCRQDVLLQPRNMRQLKDLESSRAVGLVAHGVAQVRANPKGLSRPPGDAVMHGYESDQR